MCARGAPGTGRLPMILPNTLTGNVTPSTETNVNKFLNSLELPGLGRTIGEVAQKAEVVADDNGVRATVELGFPAASQVENYREFVADALQKESGADRVSVDISSRVIAHGVQRNLKPMPGVRNIIAVASGKGGVGKSTVAVNLALSLAAEGASVGLLDADIYGPSQPQMVGLAGRQPESEDGKTMQPLEAHGLQVMSIGFLVDPDQPMIWRGPMVTSALQQLLHQTNWRDLDYLVIDMPPGTGDIQLTLAQKVPVSGAVIVTTPQDVALADARKGLEMFRKLKLPVLGVLENMAVHVCSECGHAAHLFGAEGGETMARDFGVELLGQLPLDASIREQTDSGRPTVVSAPDSAAAAAYRDAARRMAAAQATQGRDYSSRFPKIVVEES